MKIKVLGAGSAFTMKSYHSNFIIEHNGKNLLVDAGSDIRFSLRDVGLTYKDIDALYISHEHGDHSGGVETLAFCTYFDPKVKHKIQLFGNSKLLRDCWNHTWSGSLKSIQGKVVGLSDYFDVNMISSNGKFIWEDITFEIVQAVHIMNGYEIVPTYGLMITTPDGKKIYFTGDTQFNPNQIMDFYNQADFIIQDCETYFFKSGVHANYMELVTLPKNIKKKMYLTHVNDNIIEDSGIVCDEWKLKSEEDGFKGIFSKGDEIEIDK